jgi:hypothetical protein
MCSEELHTIVEKQTDAASNASSNKNVHSMYTLLQSRISESTYFQRFPSPDSFCIPFNEIVNHCTSTKVNLTSAEQIPPLCLPCSTIVLCILDITQIQKLLLLISTHKQETKELQTCFPIWMSLLWALHNLVLKSHNMLEKYGVKME